MPLLLSSPVSNSVSFGSTETYNGGSRNVIRSINALSDACFVISYLPVAMQLLVTL